MITEEDKKTVQYVVWYKGRDIDSPDYVLGSKKFIDYERAYSFYEHQSSLDLDVRLIEIVSRTIKKNMGC